MLCNDATPSQCIAKSDLGEEHHRSEQHSS